MSTNDLLESVGLRMAGNQVEFLDFGNHRYIHHTKIPIALVGHALLSPSLARANFPDVSFVSILQKRPQMDEIEALALAIVCKEQTISPPFFDNPAPFAKHLLHVINKYKLDSFFELTNGEGHYAVVPRGIGDDDAMKLWKKKYRESELVIQLMVMSIVQLYNQGAEKERFSRVPKKWHGAEAIDALNRHGALLDWVKLVVLYPGW